MSTEAGSLVNRYKRLINMTTPEGYEKYYSKIQTTHDRIEEMVYELYELSSEEIRVVERE